MKHDSLRVLFICSKNQWRSPTAEQIYRQEPSLNVRSAGTASSARHRVTYQDINWADIIIVMEDKHLRRLRADFPHDMTRKSCHVLHIPDNYRYMDPDLIRELQEAIDPLLFKDS